MALRIEDYALIGDTHTIALVGTNGSIDWLCLPRFDAPACFASLLGTAENGFWDIAPRSEGVRTRRRYRGPTPIEPGTAPDETEAWWREWSGRSTYRGGWAEEVGRSLITLKALTYAPTGGIVAAPTTSLPEFLGGVRNWDYRYCWLRDAVFTLDALMSAGYVEEAVSWRDWVLRAVARGPEHLPGNYGLAGERRLDEYELGWLSGYEQSRAVRVGNAASDQRQLDVYGEVLDTVFRARQLGMPPAPEGGSVIQRVIEWLETHWREAHAGTSGER